MGYNLRNVRNGKSTWKIAKWPSLRPLVCKSKFIRQFEFSENQSYSFQSSDCHKISFFNDGGLKLSHFDIFDMLSPFLPFVKL